MRILISNDDGLYSEGLNILIEFAQTVSKDIWVVVPDAQRSAGGHGVTIYNILKINKIAGGIFTNGKSLVSENVYTTTGTPADCVLLAIFHLMKDKKPDLMLSGVNKGENIGDDFAYSGTIAAAREASMHGIKSIAFSQSYLSNFGLNFRASRECIQRAYEYVKDLNYDDVFYNVNFPALPNGMKDKGIRCVKQGRKARRDIIERSLNNRNQEYFWLNVFVEHEPNDETNIVTDVDAVANGYISVTPVSMNFTRYDLLTQKCTETESAE